MGGTRSSPISLALLAEEAQQIFCKKVNAVSAALSVQRAFFWQPTFRPPLKKGAKSRLHNL